MPSPEEMTVEYFRLMQIAGRQISLSTTGHLWFSEREWWILHDRGRDRTFGILADGRIIEYTEMISFEAIMENPGDVCGFADARYLGIGEFHHWEK
jgi:hypothetical protein